jgi:hypothetical protein
MVSGIYYSMWAQHMFQVKYVWSNTCGQIHVVEHTCGQICVAELSGKMSIGGADPRCQSRAERIRITEIKIEKGVILLQFGPISRINMSALNSLRPWKAKSC